MCFVDLKEAFDGVPRTVFELAIKEIGIPEVVVRSQMSLYGGGRTRDRIDSEISKEFEVKVEIL